MGKPLHDYGSIDTLLKQSVEQLYTQHITEKFVGQLVVTPDCIGDFLGFITSDISDGKMISGNSLYKENETNVSYSYIYKNLPIVKTRLQQGGIRLAGLLNSLFDTSTINYWFFLLEPGSY